MDSPSQGLSRLCESSKQTPKDEFLQTSTRTTIAGLKDCREVNVITYFVIRYLSLVFTYLDMIFTIYIYTGETLIKKPQKNTIKKYKYSIKYY